MRADITAARGALKRRRRQRRNRLRRGDLPQHGGQGAGHQDRPGSHRRRPAALLDGAQRRLKARRALRRGGPYGDPERHGSEAAGIEAERLMPARPRVHPTTRSSISVAAYIVAPARTDILSRLQEPIYCRACKKRELHCPPETESTSHRRLSPRVSASPKDGCIMSRRRTPGLYRVCGGTVGSHKPSCSQAAKCCEARSGGHVRRCHQVRLSSRAGAERAGRWLSGGKGCERPAVGIQTADNGPVTDVDLTVIFRVQPRLLRRHWTLGAAAAPAHQARSWAWS